MLKFIFGLITGGIIVWVVLKRKLDSRFRGNDRVINPEQQRKKRENVEKIWEMARSKGEIANDDVERALGVSNATAERYLQELELQGRLEQVGRTGVKVIYKPKI